MKNTRPAVLAIISAVLILLCGVCRVWAKDALYLELSAHGQRLNLGLAEFSSHRINPEEARLARSMRDVVKGDLLFPGIFNIIEGGVPPIYRKISFESWAMQKADILITAYVSLGMSGRFEFTGMLHDVSSQKLILEKRYVNEVGRERESAHAFADEIVKYFLGTPGVAHSKIYFINNITGKKEVCVVDYDGAGFRRLTNDKSISLLPKVSPDGKSLLYISYRGGNTHLNVMDTDGLQRRVLCQFEGLNGAAMWMPDGRSVIATLSYAGDPNLYQVDLSGRVMKALTNSFSVDTAPYPSPDGLHLAFTSDRPGYPQIYTMDTSGANLKRITSNGECDSASWSPQGNLIAFSKSEFQGNFDIYTIDIGSGVTQRLTFGTGNNENPSWSPDGRYLVFTSTRRGKSELWIMGFDGSNPQPLGNIPGQSFTPHWGP